MRWEQEHQAALNRIRRHHLEPSGEREQRERAETAERELDELRAALTGGEEALADALIFAERRVAHLERQVTALELRAARAEAELGLVLRAQEAAARARAARRRDSQAEMFSGEVVA
jgi:hypothetical protein